MKIKSDTALTSRSSQSSKGKTYMKQTTIQRWKHNQQSYKQGVMVEQRMEYDLHQGGEADIGKDFTNKAELDKELG